MTLSVYYNAKLHYAMLFWFVVIFLYRMTFWYSTLYFELYDSTLLNHYGEQQHVCVYRFFPLALPERRGCQETAYSQ